MSRIVIKGLGNKSVWRASDENDETSDPDLFVYWVARGNTWCPPTDVYETETTIVVRVEIAGIQPEDFNILLEGRHLSIQGVRKENGEKRAYHRMEIRFGAFETHINLSTSVEANEITAEYEDGFLYVTLPKAKPNHISLDR